MTDILIQPMTAQDIPFIAALERECFSSPWTEKGLSDELTNENAVFFTAKRNGVPVGYMGMHCVLDECYVANVAVSTAERRQGIGRFLLRYAEERARERDCSFISLEVRVSNESAIGLYSAEGYERAGERKNFYSAPRENALIMTKILKDNG
ncbi:MAG: ribosomal protein S18-alanine N-acetyltransferase [Clostridia bacterium]|nr:ribosomal protein S18-alanine N-acetyltransferase [Clostridia bacterium]